MHGIFKQSIITITLHVATQSLTHNLQLYSCLTVYVMFITKILDLKLEYGLPGITIGASRARKPVTNQYQSVNFYGWY